MILSREEKLKILSKLPSDLQEMIFSDVTVGIIDKICKKYNLSEDKSAVLVSLISDILFGNTSFEQLSIILNQKLEIDEQTTANLTLDLTTELFSKVKTSLQKIRPSAPSGPAPVPLPIPTTPIPVAPIPTPLVGTPTSPQANVGADQYREPMREAPEIVDLRKTPSAVSKVEPPPLMQMPVAAAPIPPRPLTFTKPVEPPLIEAEPHKMPAPIPEEPRPQFIIRPPGLAPTDLPHDVLDLRKDKGEF